MEVEVSSSAEVQVEDHMVALELGGPSFQEVVPEQEVPARAKVVLHQVVVGVVGNGTFQEVIFQAVNLGLRWFLEEDIVALEEDAQQPCLGSPGLTENSYSQ